MLSRRGLLAAPLLIPLLSAGCGTVPPPRIQGGATTSPTPSPAPSPTPSPTPPALPEGVPVFLPGPAAEAVEVPAGNTSPWWKRVPTKHNVAFITIDDGGMIRVPEAVELIKQARIPVTLFLNSPAATTDPDYFRAIQATGAGIQNHTVTHRNLKGQSYDFQRKEIGDCSDRLEALFGQRPYLFRPPFGEQDAVTMRAARDCGIRASFFWTQTVHEGLVRYQTAEKIVKPGDVLLMHFRPALKADLLGALKAIHESGLTPARLEDYVPRAAA
jgi:peptidoglycan/xylan/chitin deacetylase (PgdA/CDA1 family)